jgi:predicted nucleic acid-binding protein
VTSYLDSSALIKLYVSERESEEVANYVHTLPEAVPFTHLHEIELKNGLRLKQFRREAQEERVRASIRLIDKDLAAGVLQKLSLSWPDVFRGAEDLSLRYSALAGCRSLDLLHVASARLLRVRDFLTYDQRQAALASKAGLKVISI